MSMCSCTSASSVLPRTLPAPTYLYKPLQLCSSLATRNFWCLSAARPKLLSRVQTRVCRPLQHSASAVPAAASGSSVEWQGLPAWRLSDVDNRRVWGDKGPVAWVGSMLASAQGQVCTRSSLWWHHSRHLYCRTARPVVTVSYAVNRRSQLVQQR